MKKLIVVVSAMAAFSLLVPHAGFAQHKASPNNIVGLYLNADGTGANSTFNIGVPVLVYLVLINPTDVENDDAPYSTIDAFECTLNFYGPVLLLLDETLPPPPPTMVTPATSTMVFWNTLWDSTHPWT